VPSTSRTSGLTRNGTRTRRCAGSGRYGSGDAFEHEAGIEHTDDRPRSSTPSAVQTLSTFPVRCSSVPKSHIYRILRSGEVRVNLFGSSRTSAGLGDELRIPPIGRPAGRGKSGKPPRRSRRSHLYEDDALIASTSLPASRCTAEGVVLRSDEQMRAARPTQVFGACTPSGPGPPRSAAAGQKSEPPWSTSCGAREGRVASATDRSRAMGDAKREWTLPLTKFLTGTGERRCGRQVGGERRTVFYGRRADRHRSAHESARSELHTDHAPDSPSPDALGSRSQARKVWRFRLKKKLAKQGLSDVLHARRLAFEHPVEERRSRSRRRCPRVSRFLEAMDSWRQTDV